MIITRYIPPDMLGFTTQAEEFWSLGELLKIPWVRAFYHHPGFVRFSLSGVHLMSEEDAQKIWWTVGVFDKETANDMRNFLPVWETLPDEFKPLDESFSHQADDTLQQ